MTCYIVSFQVNNIESRRKIWALLKTYPAYCPVNDTLWAITSDKTAVNIRDHLKTVLSADDRLFVIRSGSEAAWINTYGQENSDWLKNNL